MTKPLPIGVLISGGGTTLKNLIRKRDQGLLDVDFRLVLSSKSDAAGLVFAAEASIPTRVVCKSKQEHAEVHSERVFQPMRELGVEIGRAHV